MTSLALLGVGLLAIFYRSWGVLPVCGLVMCLLIIANLGRRADLSYQHRLLSVSAVLFSFGLLYLLANLPFVIVLPLGLLSGSIFLINIDLFRFLANRKGIVFAAAAFPMQLLYYLYSLVSFGIGIFLHLREGLLRRNLETNHHE